MNEDFIKRATLFGKAFGGGLWLGTGIVGGIFIAIYFGERNHVFAAVLTGVFTVAFLVASIVTFVEW